MPVLTASLHFASSTFTLDTPMRPTWAGATPELSLLINFPALKALSALVATVILYYNPGSNAI